jgi:hypothetical protein
MDKALLPLRSKKDQTSIGDMRKKKKLIIRKRKQKSPKVKKTMISKNLKNLLSQLEEKLM